MKKKHRFFILLFAAVIIVTSVVSSVILKQGDAPQKQEQVPSTQKQQESGLSVDAAEGGTQPLMTSTDKPKYEPSIRAIHNLVNIERAKVGAKKLTLHSNLNNSARDKCKDMLTRDYWSHNAPDGSEPWVFIKRYTGDKYTKLGENLSYGQSSDSEVVNDWLNSPTHKTNMLDKAYVYDGIGTCAGENYLGEGLQTIVVHHFYR